MGALRGGPLLVKLVGVEVFGRVVRVRVHTWRLRGGRRGVVVGRALVGARRAPAVRRALAGPTRYTPARTQPSPARSNRATRYKNIALSRV